MTTPAQPSLVVRELGRQPYEPTWQRMQAFTDTRRADTEDELWLLEHPPVFTQGQAGKPEHLLAPGDIPVVQVDRGGQVTYHGPGQLVVYPLLDLRRLGIGIKTLVHALEQVVIDLLADYEIDADRLDGAPGVYVDGNKIAALGLRVRKGCTFHGLSFNVAMDLSPFARINPCGLLGMSVIQLNELHPGVTVSDVGRKLVDKIAAHLKLVAVYDNPAGGSAEG